MKTLDTAVPETTPEEVPATTSPKDARKTTPERTPKPFYNVVDPCVVEVASAPSEVNTYFLF